MKTKKTETNAAPNAEADAVAELMSGTNLTASAALAEVRSAAKSAEKRTRSTHSKKAAAATRKANRAAKAKKPVSAAKAKKAVHAKVAEIVAKKKAAKPAAKVAGGKGAMILTLVARKGGATLADLMKQTGWQAHSVRGFISTAGKKGLAKIASARSEDGQRVYSAAK